MLSAGDIVDGKYLVVRLIGEGGMGVVYEGRNVRLGRAVAIKVMHSRLARERDLVARFEREAQAASRIGSAHIVDVIDLGDLSNGDRYMVMEFLEGESLHDRLLAKGRFQPHEIAPIAIQLLNGLARVHAAGIVHRDLKPHNIFIVRPEGGGDFAPSLRSARWSPDDRTGGSGDGLEFVKILDFGVCKMTAQQPGATDVKSGVGSLFGTLPYMAPELFEEGSHALDGRADLYSVGILIYRCVTGQLPYQATTLYELMQKLRERRAKHVRDIAPDVDTTFAGIIDRAIEWDRNDRFPGAIEFRQALIAWTQSVARTMSEVSSFRSKPAAKPMPKDDDEDESPTMVRRAIERGQKPPPSTRPDPYYDAERTVDKSRRKAASARKIPTATARKLPSELAPSEHERAKPASAKPTSAPVGRIVVKKAAVAVAKPPKRRTSQKSVSDAEIPIDLAEDDELSFDFDGKRAPIKLVDKK